MRAITGCGTTLESSSDGFIIDPTSPDLDFIAVGANAIEFGLARELGGNIPDHQPYQTEKLLSAAWTASDTESGLKTGQLVKVGSYPGGADIIEEMAIDDNYVRGLEMSDDAGQPNYVTVSAWNRAGVRKDVTAPSVAWDQTPPQQGEVRYTLLICYLVVFLYFRLCVTHLYQSTGVFQLSWCSPVSHVRGLVFMMLRVELTFIRS